MSELLNRIKGRSIEDGDCWIWQGGATGRSKTPMMRKVVGGPGEAVRRIIARDVQGKAIDGRVVTTTCGNPSCVAPEHVLVATKRALGRLNVARTGYTSNPARNAKISRVARERWGKLDAEQVADIRAAKSAREAAERHGISKSVASGIRAYRTWKDYSSPWAGLMGVL